MYKAPPSTMDHRYPPSRQDSHPTSPNHIAPRSPNTYQQPRSPTSVLLQQPPRSPTSIPLQQQPRSPMSVPLQQPSSASSPTYMQSQGGSNNKGNRTKGARKRPHALSGLSPQSGVVPSVPVFYPTSPNHIASPTADPYQQRCVKSAPLPQQPSVSDRASMPKPTLGSRRNTF